LRKRRPLPLFQPTEPDVYVIDTSAWSNIDLRNDAESVWALIVTLIGQGRIIACSQVLQELRSNSFYLFRIHPYEDALLAGDRKNDDLEYLAHVGRITQTYPAMCGARGPKTKADPYVVALAELDNYVVVADETCTHRPNRKIPGVCKQRKIRVLTLAEFVVAASATLEV